VDDKGFMTCLDCGEELYKTTSHERRFGDETRVSYRRQVERGIRNDVRDLNFADIVVTKADSLYQQFTGGSFYRGRKRRSTIFACFYYAYRMLGIPQDYKSLLTDFRISSRHGYFGIKYMGVNNPDRVTLFDEDLTHFVYTQRLVRHLGLSEEDFDSLVRLRHLTHNRSSVLNKARPQSLAAGLVLYLLKKRTERQRKVDISRSERVSEVTAVTIKKVEREVRRTLRRTNEIST
jgi:transcription initiation factor TFIIIB Brf1 subunit/transcription initiation factor TFIIB